MTHTKTYPEISTCETLRDYFQWFVERGRGAEKVMLDPRGLSYLVQPQFEGAAIGLCLPPVEATDNPEMGNVFLRAVF